MLEKESITFKLRVKLTKDTTQSYNLVRDPRNKPLKIYSKKKSKHRDTILFYSQPRIADCSLKPFQSFGALSV